MRLLRTFTTSDAVEGAVEVRMELAEALHAYRSRMRLLLTSLVIGIVLTVGAMVLQTAGFLSAIFEWFDGAGGLEYADALLGIMYTFFFLISLALGLAIIIFMGMIRRFLALMRARYGTITGTGMGRTFRSILGPRRSEIEQETGMVRDPARALLGLAREAEEEVPQVDDLLKYSTGFALLLAMMSLVGAAFTLVGVTHVPDQTRVVITLVHVLGCLMMAFAVLLQVEAQRFVSYFIARVEALETFEAQGPVPLPPGETAEERFSHCLLTKGLVEGDARTRVELAGESGGKHAFDLVMGGPGERVLARTFETVPKIDQVRDLRAAAEDVARREDELPLRVVALVTTPMGDLDVDDIVYDYLMEHPILDRRGERAKSLQIVAEVEGFYNVLPFTVP